MTYLEWLLGEINKISAEDLGIYCPDQEIKEEEKVIGELTLDEQKISAYLDKSGMEMLGELEVMDEDDKTREELEKMMQRGKEFDLIKDIFWKSVQDRLKTQNVDTSSIGIRKDWKIVSIPDKRTELSITDIFSILSED